MNTQTKKNFLLTAVLVVLTFLPFIGLSDFNTKGEPREAVVAHSMIATDNWILPQNNGGDIAYKPPMFHWAIAVASTIAGEVNEFTSRLPSAVALIVMVLAIYLFYARRRNTEVAFWAAVITFTNFEVHRAGANCRVDMVLTLFIVLALLQLFKWTERNLRGFPVWAVVFMGCATLTKGPVGIILPCMVTAVYLWLRGRGFWPVVWRFALVALASCILPIIWYAAAYQQGGDGFLYLVYEENVLRFIGKMPYGSHENPWPYNVVTVLAGYAPYTLLALLLAVVNIKALKRVNIKAWRPLKALREMDDARLFSLLSIVLIFVFYCIPKSKRSVYLLPIYPFIAYFLAEWIVRAVREKSLAVRIYGGFLAAVGILFLVVSMLIRMDLVPESIFSGKHAAENVAFLQAIHEASFTTPAVLMLTLLFLAVVYLVFSIKQKDRLLKGILAVTLCLYFSLDAYVLPSVLGCKSDKQLVEKIEAAAGGERVYSYVKTDMLHFFTINFYRGNDIVPFEMEMPEQGNLLVGEKDFPKFAERHADYQFTLAYDSHHRSCDTRQNVQLYKFSKK